MTPLSRRTVLGAAMVGAGLAVTPAAAAFADPLAPGGHRVLPDTTANEPLYRTSFEASEPDPGWIDTPTSYDVTNFRTGARSLRYDRTVSTEYVLVSIELPVEAGSQYELTCYVRTAGLAGSTVNGARIALEGYHADTGKWVGGGYSGNIRSVDWFEARTVYTAPATVGSLHVVLYLYKGLTGTAWFDDLTVRVTPPQIFTTELQTPTYRGLLIPGDHQEVALRARVGLEPADLATHSVAFSVIDSTGGVVDQVTKAAGEVVDYTCAASELAVDRHTVRAELVANADGNVAATEEWGLEKVSSVPSSYVDKHRRFIRNGEPFFPIGMYNSRIDQQTIDELSGTPFNTVLPYAAPTAAALNLAAANGISIIYSLKDYFYDSPQGAKPSTIVVEADEVPVIQARVAQLKDHPALLAWYLADEPSVQVHDRLVTHFDAVAELDPAHPVYVVHYLAPDPAEVYLRSSDVFGIDSYPVRGIAGERIDSPSLRAGVAADLLPTRAMWHVPQSFAHSALHREGWDGRFPTVAEFRNMTWQFLCQGATGLVYWELYYMRDADPANGIPDRDPDMTFAEAMGIASTVGQEVSDLVPILLSIDEPPAATLPDVDWIDVLLKAQQGTAHLFAVNHLPEAHTATFTVPAAVEVVVVGENRTIATAPDGSFSDAFAVLAVHHYAIDLVTFGSLSVLTTSVLDSGGADGRRGLITAATGMLDRAEQAVARGDRGAAETMLESYRDFVTSQAGGALAAAEVTRLVRLSGHLLGGDA